MSASQILTVITTETTHMNFAEYFSVSYLAYTIRTIRNEQPHDTKTSHTTDSW